MTRRFLLAGVCVNLFAFILYGATDALTDALKPIAISILCSLVTFPISYLIFREFVFNYGSGSRKTLYRYATSYFSIAFLGVPMFLGVNSFIEFGAFAHVVTSGILAGLSYVMQRFWVFWTK